MISKISGVLVIIIVLSIKLSGQDSTKSLAFKKERFVKRSIFYQPDLAYRIWRQYELTMEANRGNANAQHELGLRNLLGEEMQPDTIKGAYWIKKAADQNYTPALFNYGVLLFNGWGVKWDPFKAFDLFTRAALENMPQAQLLLGLLYTDDLVTPRNLSEAYMWIKKSADNGYEPAKEYFMKLSKKIPSELKDTAKNSNPGNNFISGISTQQVNSGLVYIDFDNINDSLDNVKYDDLIEDLLNSNISPLTSLLKTTQDSVNIFNESFLTNLNESAENGAPEAITLNGWLYQNGLVYQRNILIAIGCYTRAASLESRRAMMLLVGLLNSKETMIMIKDSSDAGNAFASLIWYQLYKLKIDRRITREDALNLLSKAVSQKNEEALIEAGLNNYSGLFVEVNREKGIDFWRKAAAEKNKEAKIRIAISELLGEISSDNINLSLQFVMLASEKGSILAEAALAHYYLQINDLTNAVYYFRSAAMRGSSYAYNKLKFVYEEVKMRNY